MGGGGGRRAGEMEKSPGKLRPRHVRVLTARPVSGEYHTHCMSCPLNCDVLCETEEDGKTPSGRTGMEPAA